MKKIVVTIGIGLAAFANLAQAAQKDPKDNTWYIGSKLGWSQFHEHGWYNTILNNDDSLTHDSQLGVGAFGGYQVNPYVSCEMGYDWLGRILYQGGSVNGAFKTQGMQLTAKLGHPITRDLDVYTRFGGMIWRVDSHNNITGNNHDTNISPVLAGGLEWGMTNNISTRMEYQWINGIGKSNVRPGNGMLSMGISYRFGQKKTIDSQIVAPASAPAPKAQTKHFTLKSNVLFNFNKITLTPEGQQELDRLSSQLNNLDLRDASVIILGFTDRIGSSAYNQSLSERRAQSVSAYLISKGVPSTKISARGMGKSNQTTTNACDNMKANTLLINCLAPDRRVEIKVKGLIKDIIAQPKK